MPSFDEWLAHLDEYIAERGTALVSVSYVTASGVKLGSWVSRQRASRRQGKLPPEREALLGALPGWLWAPDGLDWDDGYPRLEAYAAEHGNTSVPRGYITADGYPLGKWTYSHVEARWSGKLTPEREALLGALPGWEWDRDAADWDDGYPRLEAYATEHGNTRVPPGYITADGYPLRQWVDRHRHTRRPIRLSEDRRVRAEALPGWLWNPVDVEWDVAIPRLEAYAAEHGNTRVPPGYITADGHPLGQWVDDNRTEHSKRCLSEDRRVRVEALPGWVWDQDTADWGPGYSHLEAYVAEHGHARVRPGHITGDGFELGAWVDRQRELRFRRERSLPVERWGLLEALPGWVWHWTQADQARVDAWEDAVAKLEAYASEHGHTRVPSSYFTDDGFALGTLVGDLRSYQTGTRGRSRLPEVYWLTEGRIAQLEALPGWEWDQEAADWEDGYAVLEAYVAEHGHPNVPPGYITADGYRLGQWVGRQRETYATPGWRLRQDHQDRLEALPGWVWFPEWEAGYDQLLAYVAEHGHARVPAAHVTGDGFALGDWVADQRSAVAQLRREDGVPHRWFGPPPINEQQVQRLRQVAGWEWTAGSAAWEDGFVHLEEYAGANGTAAVPFDHVTADGYPLGHWVATRQAHGVAGLSAERAARLNALPGWDWGPEWKDWYARLEAYAAAIGDARPPSWETDGNLLIGAWVQGQRFIFRETQRNETWWPPGTRSPTRAGWLEALPGWEWDQKEADWEEGFYRAEWYAEDHGHARVPAGYVTDDGFPLGSWVAAQRAAWSYRDDERIRAAFYRNPGPGSRWVSPGRSAPPAEPMTDARQARLETLPGWLWSDAEVAWEDGYAQLAAYGERYGHTRVPSKHITADGYPLGKWVSAQRAHHDSEDPRAGRLEKLPAWYWSGADARWQWDDYYLLLRSYSAEHGHTNVPSDYVTGDGFALGTWTKKQRARPPVPAERRAKLAALPGWNAKR